MGASKAFFFCSPFRVCSRWGLSLMVVVTHPLSLARALVYVVCNLCRRYNRSSPPIGRGPPGREGYRYDGRYEGRSGSGRYERDHGAYEGGYKGSGEAYGRRGREGYDEGYAGYDDYRRDYRVGIEEERRHRGGRSRSRSRPHDGYRGDRYRYPTG